MDTCTRDALVAGHTTFGGALADGGSRVTESSARSSGGDALNFGDETDDIVDILDVGLLGGLGGLAGLSASAKEFTPGGGFGSVMPEGGGGHLVATDASSGREAWGEGAVPVPASGDISLCDSSGGGVGELYAQVQLEAELLEVMAETFSDCSPECLQVALGKSDWDLDRASAAVLAALQSSDPERPAKPCRYLLGGECRRSDCAFSHDFASTTCRFWLHGQCFHLDGCLFRHDLDVPDDIVVEDAGEATGGSVEGRGGGMCAEDSGRRSARASSSGSLSDGGDSSSSALGIDQFPSLESKTPASVRTLSSPIVTIPAVAAAVAVANRPTIVESAPEVTANSVDGRPTEAKLSSAVEFRYGRGKSEDVLLAAVVAPRKGAGGRKGGRGRKTRFTAISIQALMRDTPTAENISPPNPSLPQSAAYAPSAAREDPNMPWGATPAPRATVAARTTTGVSFADVVASDKGDVGGSKGVAPPKAWGARGRGVGGGGDGRDGKAGSWQQQGAWVSTGDAVALQYQEARREAAELARARNKLFTSATEAFRRGQGMAARDLARRGRELNAKMKDKHRQAAGQIFASRNPDGQVLARKAMDLHGLHVAEAVEVLDRELAVLLQNEIDSVRVLTGTGHHSKGPTSKARLIPAVENFCQSRCIPYRRIPDQGTGHVGVIDLDLAGLSEIGDCVGHAEMGEGGWVGDPHSSEYYHHQQPQPPQGQPGLLMR